MGKKTKLGDAVAPRCGRDEPAFVGAGAPLVAALIRRAQAAGDSLPEAARKLGVTYSYIAQLRNGQRHVEHICEAFATACADYLGVPPIVVKILAGKVRATDFLVPGEFDERRLDAALRRVEEDVLLGCWLPPSIYAAPYEIKQFVILCYQEACGQEIVPHRALPQLVASMQIAAAMHEDASGQLEERWREVTEVQ